MTLVRNLAWAAALVCVFASTAPAAESTPKNDASIPRGTYLLRYKFALGETMRYEVKQSTNLRTSMENTTQRNSSQTESVKVWKVTDVLPTGEIEFIHLVESVKMSNEGTNQPKRSFDSASSEPPSPGFEAAARAIGTPLVQVRISPSGKILSREQKTPQQEAPAEDMPITLELPEQAVRLGERWSHSYDVPVKKASGAEVKIRTRRLCRLRQVKNNIATIDVEYQILTPVDATLRSQIIDRLTKGNVRFDIERGRVIQQTHEVDRREVGFAPTNQASSMHLAARTTERLLTSEPAVAEIIPASAETK
jgi:hypothetical protein